MEFSFEAKVVLILEHKQGMTKSKHISTSFNLIPDDNLQSLEYLDSKDMMTKSGSKVFSNVLIQGLVGNIHFAHEKGFRDGAEHLRWIISELERGFITIYNIKESNF